MSYMSEQHTRLWLPELYALGVPPMWAVLVLLLWWADYCVCSLVAVAGLQSSWLPVESGQVMRWLATQPRDLPGLVLTNWWAEPGLWWLVAVLVVPHLVSACW